MLEWYAASSMKKNEVASYRVASRNAREGEGGEKEIEQRQLEAE